MTRDLVCAIDVGTGSARAGILDLSGSLLASAEHPIAMHRPLENHAEHDSEDIWRGVCRAVVTARRKADIGADRIVGISFDGTCSLVVRGADGRPVSASSSGEERWDTIVWFDHRAIAEADECTASGHRVLDFVGGVMSPEMQTPKLMWLKRHLPQSWHGAGHFFDLADFLTWKACGSMARSQCTLTAKWTYLAHADGWQCDFFAAMGIGDMLERGGLPESPKPVGAALGTLTPKAANELGLTADCIVGTGTIDAFAGGLGSIGGLDDGEIEQHLALITGTSSCLMGFAQTERHVSGVWGPFYGASLPGLWLSEGGQSATGALLDHVIRSHAAGGRPDHAMHLKISARIAELIGREGPGLASRLHVLPDFHGNRSPLADPHALGVISGLTLDESFDGLCRLYWRAAVAVALGARQILETLGSTAAGSDTLHVTGGACPQPFADAALC